MKNAYISSSSTFRACHRQWCLDLWHLSSQGIITRDRVWGQLDYPDNWKWRMNSMFYFALCTGLLLYLFTTTAVTLGDCSNILKSIRYSCLREVWLQVPWSVWIPCAGHMNLCTHPSPVQAGQEDSDLSVAHFLVPNSKWGWKKLHYS